MKLPKALYILPLTIGPILYVSASEYEFENIKLNQVSKEQNTYQPKGKLDEYIIKGATYSTKFVPLMNDGAEGSEYTDIMSNDVKRLLVDAGFDFANSKANDEIQKTEYNVKNLNINVRQIEQQDLESRGLPKNTKGLVI